MALPQETIQSLKQDVQANPGHVAQQSTEALADVSDAAAVKSSNFKVQPQAATRDEEGIPNTFKQPGAESGAGPTKQKKIAVLTSGGDSAGMNAAVRAVVRQSIARGCQAYIVREGWEGLVRGNSTEPTPAPTPKLSKRVSFSELPPSQQHKLKEAAASRSTLDTSIDYSANLSEAPLTFGFGELLKDGAGEGELDDHEHDGVVIADEADKAGKTLKGRYIVRVGWDDVRGWLGEGGTLIGSSRCPSFRTREGRLQAANNLIQFGIDCLAVCGGDGSLTGADMLRKDWTGLVKELLDSDRITQEQADNYKVLNIVGLVGSIDNDMAGTDLTIGAITALHRICESIDSISSTASSHSRAFVIEVMGRHCGWLALLAGIATGADFIFIPENPPASDDWESEMCAVLKSHRTVGKRKSIVIVAEGALDRNLKPIKPEYIKDILVDRLGLDTRVTTLGHTQRGGKPAAVDRILPTLQGVRAVQTLLSSTPETSSKVIGIKENKIEEIDLMQAVADTQAVAAAIERKDFAGAMAMRDPEFNDILKAFRYSSKLSKDELVPDNKRLKIGIIHVGAPAGGMNAATRQAVRYCHARGHTPYAIYNGFDGLLEGNVSELSWLRVDNWTTRGGSELGTNRTLPDCDLGAVAAAIQFHKFDGLLLIGGFEAFNSVLIMEKARSSYPSFQIPMIHLPATLSNNVPATDFSLGSDTSLNALVDACDAIKQSASASRNRVFVVETQGGMSGYIATLGALAVGAVLVYTPEAGINLSLLQDDVEFLRKRYSLDVKGKSEGRLVIRSEKSSNVYTTEVITKILKEEGKELFDARSASLGHTLQGGVPSPLDRTRAARLAHKCMEFLEQHAVPNSASIRGKRAYSTKSAAMIAIRGSQLLNLTMDEVLEHTDMKRRRGTNVWWEDIKGLVELMGGRTGLVGDAQ